MNYTRNLKAILVSLFVSPFLIGAFTTEALAYKVKTHRDITRDIAQVNNLQDKLTNIGLTDAEAQRMEDALVEGSEWPDFEEADSDSGEVGIDREINPLGCQEFGDYVSGRADPDHWYPVGAISIIKDRCGKAPENAKLFMENAKERIEQALNRLENLDPVEDRRRYEEVRAREIDRLETGFNLLGHSLHYAQDMGVPHHTVGIVRLKSTGGKKGHDNYESWAKNNYETNYGSISRPSTLSLTVREEARSNNNNLSPSDIPGEVKELAEFSNRHYADANNAAKNNNDNALFNEGKDIIKRVSQLTDSMIESATSEISSLDRSGGGGGGNVGGGSSSEPIRAN